MLFLQSMYVYHANYVVNIIKNYMRVLTESSYHAHWETHKIWSLCLLCEHFECWYEIHDAQVNLVYVHVAVRPSVLVTVKC